MMSCLCQTSDRSGEVITVVSSPVRYSFVVALVTMSSSFVYVLVVEVVSLSCVSAKSTVVWSNASKFSNTILVSLLSSLSLSVANGLSLSCAVWDLAIIGDGVITGKIGSGGVMSLVCVISVSLSIRG